MRLAQLATFPVKQFVNRLLWRVIGYALIGLFALIALYHLTASGTVALELRVGPFYAHLIVAGIFIAAILVTLAILAMTRTRPVPKPVPTAQPEQRRTQIAMLVDAVMVGYSLARKRSARAATRD